MVHFKRCLLVCQGSGREFGLGSKQITWWRSLLEGTEGSWKLCMLPCHNCQNSRPRRSQEVGKDLKTSYVGQTAKGRPIFIKGVDPSRHHDLVYGSRLIRNQANSLLYEQFIYTFTFAKYTSRTGSSKSK